MRVPGPVLANAITLMALLVPAASARDQGPEAQGPRPVFRSGTTIVPVDVRVVDGKNRPVTDLTKSDFTVTENGVPQEIVAFTTQTFTPEAGVVPGPIRRRDEAIDPVAPRPYRVFLLVLGQGRLKGVKDSLAGLEHFLRDDLQPQDYVAVLAYNRATEFTSDHQAILALVERYRTLNPKIEAEMRMAHTGLRAMYDGGMFRSTERVVDELFGDARELGVRRIIPPATVAIERTPVQWKAVDALMECGRTSSKLDCAMASARVSGMMPLKVGETAREASSVPSMDEFLSLSLQHLQDASSIYAGIEALRRLDGEKHLIFLSPIGATFGEMSAARQLGRVASDARVSIDIIHTDGMTSYTAVEQGVLLAKMTGGRFDINRNRWATRDIDLINQDTLFEYVIGYKPTKPDWDGTFRNIRVTVNRKGLKVANREGYFARDTAASPAKRTATLFSRVAAAAGQAREVGDIAMVVRATASGVTRDVTFQLAVDISRLTFERSADGENTGSFDIALFCLDAKRRPIGELWQAVSMRLDDASRRAVELSGAQLRISVPTTGVVDSAKIVVYEYAGDIIGTRNVSFPKPAKR